MDNDFDKFLQDSVADEARYQDIQQYHEALDKRFQAAVDQAGLKTLTNLDPEKQNTLEDAAVNGMISYLRQEIEQPNDMDFDEFEEFIRIRAATFITNLTIQELSLITMIKISITSYEVDYLHNPTFDHLVHFESKRTFLARLLASGDYSSVDDPWFTFANTIIPGGVIDFSLAENQDSLMSAMEAYVYAEEKKEKQRLLFTQVQMMLESSDNEEDEILAAIRVTGEVIAIAMTVPSQYEREDRIRVALRTIHADDEKVSSVMLLLGEEFPIK